MRRILVVSTLVALAFAVILSCAKKKPAPNAPPADPICGLSATSLTFGTVTVGGSADRQFTVTNTGGGTLNGTVSESCAEFAIVGTTSYSLGAGQSAAFTVRFSPTSPGAKTCTVGTGSTLCASIACSGTGQSATPVCQVSPTLMNFGSLNYGSSDDLILSITNVGGGTLAGTVTGARGDFSIQGSASYSLGAGQLAEIRVRFIPSSSGSQACTLSVGSSGCSQVVLQGSGQLPFDGDCSVRVVGDTLDFGLVSVGFSAERSYSLKNFSTVYWARGSVSEVCPEFELTSDPFFHMSQGASFGGTLRFSPTREGLQVCALPVSCSMDNAGTPGGRRDYLFAKGVGVGGTPICQVSTNRLEFGSVIVGESKDLSLMVTNTGTGSLSGQAGPSPCPPFSFVGTTSYSLGPGQATALTLRFTPTQSGQTVTCASIPIGSACAPITAVGKG